MSAPVSLSSGCCSPPCPTSPQTAVPGPAGESAFSFTVGNFIQPAIGANVTVSFSHDGWVVPGQTVFIQSGGFYTVVSVSGLTVTLTNNGSTSNSAPGTIIVTGSKISPGGVGGTTGNAFTTTAANYTQPNVGAQVNVTVGASNWAAVGQRVFVATGGYYTVFSIPDATHLNLTNDGDPPNAAPAVVINSPQQVSPAGLRGPAGATGVSTLNGVSPTTTKGDLIVDNGANSPLASDVRLGVGTNGKALVADSTQATGLNYATITPNTVATSGDIAIYNGSAGTPTPLKDSKLLITSDGAIQSTPTGGNARGTKAIDLQVDRGVGTQVASGNNSALLGGANNTASGAEAVVAGGDTNVASNIQAFIGGGLANAASGVQAGVVCGTNNTASGAAAFIGGGQGNVASSGFSTVGAGVNNTASNTNATVCGGDGNTASGADSVVCGGLSNTASATASAVIVGDGAKATLFGQVTHNAITFAAPGDCQVSEIGLSNATTDNTPTELFLDGTGASQRAILPTDTAWAFEGQVLARTSAGNNGIFGFRGGIKNNAGAATLIGSVTVDAGIEDAGFPGPASVGITADAVNLSLKITVTGAMATNIRWLANVRLTEIHF